MAAMEPSHPLLQELSSESLSLSPSLVTRAAASLLTGLLHRLRTTPRPVRDRQPHLTPFCETVELVLRHGLKSTRLQSADVMAGHLSLSLSLQSPTLGLV